MHYDKSRFESVVEEFGEVFFVLDSDREYEVHGKRSYEFKNFGDTVEVEGKQGDEYLIVTFHLDNIEHHYAHKEV